MLFTHSSELFLFLDDFARKGGGGEKRNNEHFNKGSICWDFRTKKMRRSLEIFERSVRYWYVSIENFG